MEVDGMNGVNFNSLPSACDNSSLALRLDYPPPAKTLPSACEDLLRRPFRTIQRILSPGARLPSW